jgi:hypothetical protein
MRFMRTAMAAGGFCAVGFLVPAVSNGEEPARRFAIGDLRLDLDPAQWSVDQNSEGWSIRGDKIHIDVVMQPGAAALCSPLKMSERARPFHSDAWEFHETTMERRGLQLHVATLDMGCRNWTGSPVFACTAHGGNIYTFTADAGGCRETPPMYDGYVLEALGTLSAE